MLNKHIVIRGLGFLFWLLPLSTMAGPDKDHPLVGRYEGSELAVHTHTDFDETNIIDGPFVSYSSGREFNSEAQHG